MITREADYAIRAVMYLAQNQGEKVSLSTHDLADEMSIPYDFLRRIVQKLTKIGFLTSFRGNGGGLRLAVSVKELSLYDVLSAIDSRGITLNTCLVDENNCPRNSFCQVHHAMHRLQNTLETELQKLTFDKFIVPDGKKPL